MTNTVCTFFELTEGEDTVAQPFYGLERELLLKSLRTLEKQHKAEIFESEDGVKFFQLWEQFFIVLIVQTTSFFYSENIPSATCPISNCE